MAQSVIPLATTFNLVNLVKYSTLVLLLILCPPLSMEGKVQFMSKSTFNVAAARHGRDQHRGGFRLP